MSDGIEPRAETRLEISLQFSNGARLGPDELRVIVAVRRARSILGASRVAGFSYRTCWLIVDALNRAFETPVIATFPGRRGGGAELTPFGERLIALYGSIERRARAQAKPALDEVSAALNSTWRRRSSDGELGAARSERAPRRLQGS